MSYTAPQYTLAAGQRLPIPGEGKFVRVIEATDAFELGLDNGALFFIEQGLAVESPGFKEVVIYNPQAVAITVRLGISSGVIHDSRFSVPGTMPVQVENFPAVVTPDNWAYEVKSTDVVVNSYGGGMGGAGTVLITAADNPNGVILKDFQSEVRPGGNGTNWLKAGSDYVFYLSGASPSKSVSTGPIKLPAGVEIRAYADSSYAFMFARLEKL